MVSLILRYNGYGYGWDIIFGKLYQFLLFFPAVIERQWAAISQFHDIIKNASDAQLSNSSASVEETMEAILSVILLKATSKGIFEEFLHQRQLELISKLKRHDVSAKNHITYSLSAISSVLCIVHQTFYQVNKIPSLFQFPLRRAFGNYVGKIL